MLKATIKGQRFWPDLVCWLMKNRHLLLHFTQTFQSVLINRGNYKTESWEWNVDRN